MTAAPIPLQQPCRACGGTDGEVDPVTGAYVRCTSCRRSVSSGRRAEEEFFGAWTTEVDAAAELDRRIETSGLFDRCYQEVDGFYLAARPNRPLQKARIDRILFPSEKLRASGWSTPIGVEIKRSGEPLGPALAQAIDYTYAAFGVGPSSGYWVHLEKIFLWPLTPQSGAIQSVMIQNGVGALHGDELHPLIFTLERHVLQSRCDGSVTVHATQSGRKVGSR